MLYNYKYADIVSSLYGLPEIVRIQLRVELLTLSSQISPDLEKDRGPRDMIQCPHFVFYLFEDLVEISDF